MHEMKADHAVFPKNYETQKKIEINKWRFGIKAISIGEPPVHNRMGETRELGLVDI